MCQGLVLLQVKRINSDGAHYEDHFSSIGCNSRTGHPIICCGQEKHDPSACSHHQHTDIDPPHQAQIANPTGRCSDCWLLIINFLESLQVLEKNHFLGAQNRSAVKNMIEYRLSKPQVWLLLMAAVLIIATMAPVAVLAA